MDLSVIRTRSPDLLPVLIDIAAQALQAAGHVPPRDLALTLLHVTSCVPLDWTIPDSRVASTFQAPVITEYGAVGIAAAVLPDHLRIVRVVPRQVRQAGQARLVGTRVDYFIGNPDTSPPAIVGVLEIGGIANGSLTGLLSQKVTQASGSPYRAFYPAYAFACVFQKPEAELRKV